MRIAFLIDPPQSFRIYKDSTYAMMCEAAARGHELHILLQEQLAWRAGTVSAATQRLHLTGDNDHEAQWFRLDAAQTVPLKDFDAVLMRKDPPFDMEYVYSTYLLELAQKQGARVFNDPRTIRDCNEKLTIARYPQFTAPTMVTRDAALIHEFLAEHGDIILKPLDGMGGTSVFRVNGKDPNLNVIIETITHYGARTVMAQRYIPQIVDGDKRVLLIGGKPVPYSLARIPKPGETRGNLAAGGTGVARELTPRDREIAETLAPQLYAQGLLLVGLDIIGDCLTEVNVTSPTCFREITDQTGFNVAGMMLDALEGAVAQH
jgi:glutathione synthase